MRVWKRTAENENRREEDFLHFSLYNTSHILPVTSQKAEGIEYKTSHESEMERMSQREQKKVE